MFAVAGRFWFWSQRTGTQHRTNRNQEKVKRKKPDGREKRTGREAKVHLHKKGARESKKNWIAARAERETDHERLRKSRLMLCIKVHRQL